MQTKLPGGKRREGGRGEGSWHVAKNRAGRTELRSIAPGRRWLACSQKKPPPGRREEKGKAGT